MQEQPNPHEQDSVQNEQYAIPHQVSISFASVLTKRYRDANPSRYGGYFRREIFDEILNQSGCTGIRYYLANDNGNAVTLVVVGVDANGNDIHTGIIGDTADPCPSVCGANNPLNS